MTVEEIKALVAGGESQTIELAEMTRASGTCQALGDEDIPQNVQRFPAKVL